MKNIINREQPFQVLATNFSIGPSSSGYELEISADGVNYTSLFTVGANITRMVTGVANGSYYRLAGNTDEDVVVNWRTQCNDGGEGGGGGTGPQGPQGPQGGVGPQGPQGQDGIEQAPTVLKSVNELPSDAEEGDVVSLYAEGEGLPYGIIFEERDDLGSENAAVGGRFSFPIGAFDEIEESDAVYVAKVIAPDDTEHELYIYGNEWNQGGAVLTDIDGGIYISMGVGSDSAGANDTNDMTADYHYTGPSDEYMVVDFYPSSTGSVSFDIPQAETEIGVFQYDGNDWNAVGGGAGGSQDFIHLDNLGTAGETGKTYEYNGRLFKWVNGAGVWGEWLSGWDNSGYPESDGKTSIILKYSTLPIGEFCRVYDFNNLRTYLVFDGEHITAYTDSGHTIVYTAVTIGCVDVNMSNQTYENYKVLLTWTDGKLIFKTGGNASLRNRVSTTVSAPHYEALDMSVAASNDAGTGDMGIPIWNKEGIVIGKKTGYNNRTIYFNTTGYTNYKHFITDGSWQGPDRIFVPSQSGTQGQVLTSNGNAEPVWETMIKAVKITSDAYEALAVKDPNTLYLIDDEA